MSKFINYFFIATLFFTQFLSETSAQCNIFVSGSVCVGQPAQFSVNAPGASNINWNFAGTQINNNPTPTFPFPSPGQYQVTVTLTTATGQPCSNTITVTVNPNPIISWKAVNSIVQCFNGNVFCIEDMSTPATGTRLKRSTVILAGTNATRLNPENPYQICISTADPEGGLYSLTVEIEDSNGCIVKKDYNDTFKVVPSIFIQFTSNKPKGCDEVHMKLQNTSLIDKGAVDSFVWNFGDGTKNTTDWDSISKWYYTQGPDNGNFRVSLTVTDTNGCTESFTIQDAATNLIINNYIEAEKDSTCISDNVIKFELKPGLLAGTSSFLWNFGDPLSGGQNFDFINSTNTEHRFSVPGPFLISYTLQHPICGMRTLYKQISVIGPQSVIPRNSIPINERYQCDSFRSVFFPNSSLFFHNDENISDDASGYIDINSNPSGWHYYFDSANQTLRQSNLDLRGNYGTNKCVFRIWDFDDDHAPTCTTDSRPIYPQSLTFNNLHFLPDPNTGLYPKNTYDSNNDWINCRYSLDSLPFHSYPKWERIYKTKYYDVNEPFEYAYLDKVDNKCYKVFIDTTQPDLHRELFYLRIPRCNIVTLYHEDTCHAFKCESTDKTPICILGPNAKGLMKDGVFCFGESPLYGVIFLLDNTKPGASMLEAYINPDTALNPNRWISYLPGGLTGTVPRPEIIPPYETFGAYPNRLLYHYKEPSFIADDSTGYAHVGLIIGNGSSDSMCYDTAYYHKFVKFPLLYNDIEILKPATSLPDWANTYKLCKGDSIVIRPTLDNKTNPTDVDEISYRLTRIAPSIDGDPRFYDYTYIIYENFEWFKKVPNQTYLDNRMLKTVYRYKGQQLDTIETENIHLGRVYKYSMRADISQVRQKVTELFSDIGFDIAQLTSEEVSEIIAAGCIDTTGLSSRILFDYTRDSFESFHYKDTSIMPLDEYLNTNNSINKAYTFIAEEDGIFDLVFTVRSRIGGCLTANSVRVITGFYNRLSVSDSIICNAEPIKVIPYFRYFEVLPEGSSRNPPWLDPVNWWLDREGEAGQIGKEGITYWDWSLQDDDPLNPQTIFGAHPYGATGYVTMEGGGDEIGRIYYNNPGFYTMRIASEDSSGCRDTIYQNIYSSKIVAAFGIDKSINTCINILDLLDSSYIIDPCQDSNNNNIRECDRIIRWRIDWGDGKNQDLFDRNTFPPFNDNKISHNYTRNGKFLIRLIVDSETGCSDTAEMEIDIKGPIPEFTLDRFSICAGDSINFFNKSDNVTTGSQWAWFFGDEKARSEDFNSKKDSFWHTYNKPGKYSVFLLMFDSVDNNWCGFTYPDTVGGSQNEIFIHVNGKDTVNLKANKYKICPGETINFEAFGEGNPWFFDYVAIDWNFDAATSPPDSNQIVRTFGNNRMKTSRQFNQTGTYIITASGIHNPVFTDRCPDSDTIVIEVGDVFADFEIDSSNAPNFCFANTSEGGDKHRWGFYHEEDITETDGKFIQDIESNDIPICRNFAELNGLLYVCLIADSEQGCSDTVCKTIANYKSIQVPNVFTPGLNGTGDGFNDLFKIPITGHDLFEITIRNRWGDLIFESKDSEVHWNGLVDNTGVPCPDGTYYYMLNYRFKGTYKIIHTNGVVMLIWEK
jgi:gliding motility-associated-like protein